MARTSRPYANGWQAGAHALSAKFGEALAFDAIFDFMQATYRYGVRPSLQQALAAKDRQLQVAAAPPPAFFPLWFGRYGVARLFAMALRWQDAYQPFSIERLGKLDPAFAAMLTWTPLRPAAASHGPYRIVELTSQQALEHEGRKQQHCVASYAVKCLKGDSAIYSLRDRVGNVLSTFEVGLAQNHPTLLQHIAVGKASAPKVQQTIAARFVDDELKSIPTRQLAAARAARHASSGRIRGRLAAPNIQEAPLSDDELARLRDLVAFAHPDAAVKQGVLAYILECGVDPAAFVRRVSRRA